VITVRFSLGTDVEYQVTMAPKVLLSHLLFLGYCSKVFLIFMSVTLSLNCYETASVLTAFLFSPVVKEDEMVECMAWIQEKRNSYRVLVGKPEAETTWKN
jgi:hypothetical protein